MLLKMMKIIGNPRTKISIIILQTIDDGDKIIIPVEQLIIELLVGSTDLPNNKVRVTNIAIRIEMKINIKAFLLLVTVVEHLSFPNLLMT